MSERVLLNDENLRGQFGPLDEVVMQNCTAHLEQLDADAWYLGLTRADGTEFQIWLRKKGRAVHAYFEDEAGKHECPK